MVLGYCILVVRESFYEIKKTILTGSDSGACFLSYIYRLSLGSFKRAQTDGISSTSSQGAQIVAKISVLTNIPSEPLDPPQ